jgi:hypothetical protein
LARFAITIEIVMPDPLLPSARRMLAATQGLALFGTALLLLGAVCIPGQAQSVFFAGGQTNLGGVEIGSSSTLTLTYNTNTSVTLGSKVKVLTQGVPEPVPMNKLFALEVVACGWVGNRVQPVRNIALPATSAP